MTRFSRKVACLTWCLFGSILIGQSTLAQTDDRPTPAPGEPTIAAEGDGEAKPVDPIKGTQTGAESAEDAAQASDEITLRTELEELRRELTARIAQIETRLDDQATHIEALQQAAADRANTTTANKPPTPTETGPDVTPDHSADRDAELARVQGELETLRADYKLLLATISEHASAINDHATGLAKHTESIQTQDERLTRTGEKLELVQISQQDIERQLLDVASSEGAGGQALKILGNMQPIPNDRGALFQSARYRLRIHNTTGSEQTLFVNGVQWTVRADEWTYVPIPLGPVTLHRPGLDPLEVAEDHVQWRSDNRGFYVDYDLELNEVSVPATE